jgi:hypothetical protein
MNLNSPGPAIDSHRGVQAIPGLFIIGANNTVLDPIIPKNLLKVRFGLHGRPTGLQKVLGTVGEVVRSSFISPLECPLLTGTTESTSRRPTKYYTKKAICPI